MRQEDCFYWESRSLKISDDEITFFMGMEDMEEGVAKIQEQYPERKRLNDDDRDSFTDFSWYFNNIIKKMDESGCIIRCIKYEEYLD